MKIGVDCGTYNLVVCKRDKDNNFSYKREVNAFIEVPLDNRFVFNMMKKAGVPLIEKKEVNIAYALGEAAVSIAYTMSQMELKRPMKDGCLNPLEKHAQQIMSIMLHSMLGELETDNETLVYCVPANAINEQTDAIYHTKVLEAIFKAFEDSTGKKVKAQPINEALALAYAELESKQWTGIGCSCGAGQINVCYSKFGSPIFSFSIVNSGDYIDKMAAKAAGESPTFINKQKEKLDLTVPPDSLVMGAIRTQYEIMIEKTIVEIKKGLEAAGNSARSETPIDFVVAGGTSSPKGFENLFQEHLKKANLPIEIGSVIKPKDPLFSVARGCLIAAENS